MNKNEDTKKMFNMLIHEYLRKEGYQGTAKLFLAEANVEITRESQPFPLLYKWFEAFNDICMVRSGKKKNKDSLARIEGVMLKLENDKKRISRKIQFNKEFFPENRFNIREKISGGVSNDMFNDKFNEKFNGNEFGNYDYDDERFNKDDLRFNEDRSYPLRNNFENVSRIEQLSEGSQLYKNNSINRNNNNNNNNNNNINRGSINNNNNNNNNNNTVYHINNHNYIIQGHPNPNYINSNYKRNPNYSFNGPENNFSNKTDIFPNQYKNTQYNQYQNYPRNYQGGYQNFNEEKTRKTQSMDERISSWNQYDNNRLMDYTNNPNYYNQPDFFYQSDRYINGQYQNNYPENYKGEYENNFKEEYKNEYPYEQEEIAVDQYKTREQQKLNFNLQKEFNCGKQKNNFLIFSKKHRVIIIAGSDRSLSLIDYDTNEFISKHVIFEKPIINLEINEIEAENTKRETLIAVCSIDDRPRIYKICKNPLSLVLENEINAENSALICTFGRDCLYTLNIEDEIEKYSLDGTLIKKVKVDIDLRNIMWVKDEILLLVNVNKTFYLDFDTNEQIDILNEPASIVQRTDKYLGIAVKEDVYIYDINFNHHNTISLTERPHSLDIIDEENIFVGTYKLVFWFNMTDMVSFKAHDNIISCLKIVDREKFILATSSLSGNVKVWSPV
ncbi:hypothetical protein DMUE_0269 [Dictyocoela muelleri]|nr:hypothetical protein DMUE_0269 [Dictyocoela muelleri]